MWAHVGRALLGAGALMSAPHFDTDTLVEELVGLLKLKVSPIRTSRLDIAKAVAERAEDDGLDVEGPEREDGTWEVRRA